MHQCVGDRGDHPPGRLDRTEPANNGCRGYAKCLDGVRVGASSRSDWTEFGVVSVSDLGGQRPQLGGPAAEAAKPAADRGGRHAQRGGDATVTQAARLGQECGTDDLDHIEASEQRGRRDQHVRRPASPAAGSAEAQAPASIRPAKLALAREPPGTEHTVPTRRAPQAPLEKPRLDPIGLLSNRKHARIRAPKPTSESSLTGATGGKGQLVLRMVEHASQAPQASHQQRDHGE